MRLLSLLCLFVMALTVQGDFLNTYFNDKTFGVNPGPCPAKNGGCKINLNTGQLPSSIQNIRLCLVEIKFKLFFFIPVKIELICDNVRNFIRSGTMEVYNLQCKKVGLGSIGLTERSRSADTVVNTFSMDNFFQQCAGKLDIQNLVLGKSVPVFGFVSIRISADKPFSTHPRKGGQDARFDLLLKANGGGFSNTLVNFADIQRCHIPRLDIGARIPQDFVPSISGVVRWIKAKILSLLLRIVEYLMGRILCDALEQGGTLFNGQKGILNEGLDAFNIQYDNFVRQVAVINPNAEEAFFVADPGAFGATPQELADSFKFRESRAYGAISFGINEFLGSPAFDPLRVNEVIQLLTDPDGEFFLDVTEEDFTSTFPLNFANLRLQLVNVELRELDNVDTLKILDAVGDLDYTLRHNVFLDKIAFKVGVRATFSKGAWVKTGDSVEDFTFDVGLSLEDVELDTHTLQAFDLDTFGQLQFGQLFDIPNNDDFVTLFNQGLDCIAPSVYAIRFSDLSVQVGRIANVLVDNVSGQGLSRFLGNSANLIALLSTVFIKQDASNVLRGRVRDELNEILRTEIGDVADFSQCPPYVPVFRDDPYLRYNIFPATFVYPIFNDVLGNFEANSNVDLNKFIQAVLEFLAEDPDFPIATTGVEGDWRTVEEPLENFQAFQSPAEFINVDFVEITNLNSIDRFRANNVGDLGLSFEFGFGGGDAFKLSTGFEVVSQPLGNNEEFVFDIELEGITFDLFFDKVLLNTDNFFRLRINQTEHIPCLQSLFDGLKADLQRSQGSAERINFDLRMLSAPTGTDLDLALRKLSDEFEAAPNNPRFTAASNYFFNAFFESALRAAQNGDFSSTPETCNEEETSLDFLMSLFIGVTTFDSTTLVETCLADVETPLIGPEIFQDEQLGEDTDRSDFLDLQDSSIVSILKNFFSVNRAADTTAQGVIESFLDTLALADSHFIARLFIKEPDGSVTFELPLNDDNEVLQFLNLSAFSIKNDDDFKAEVLKLRVENIGDFLDELRLFNPISSYITRHFIKFNPDSALTFKVVFNIEANRTILDGAPIGSPLLKQEITLSAAMTDAEIDMEFFSVFNTTKFNGLSVAHFLNFTDDQVFRFSDTALTCLLANIPPRMLQMRKFFFTFNDLSEEKFETSGDDIFSDGFRDVVTATIDLLLEFYGAALNNICHNCLRTNANDILRRQVELSNEPGACPAFEDLNIVPIQPENQLLRYSDSDDYRAFQEFLHDVMYVNNFEMWNLFIGLITEQPFFDANDPLSTGEMELFYKDRSYGSLKMDLSKLLIEELDTFRDVEFFEPRFRPVAQARQGNEEPFDEENDPFKISVVFNYTGPSTYSFETRLTGIDLFKQGPEVVNELELNFTLTNVLFDLEAILALNLTTLMNVQFNQVDDFDELPCLITPVERFDVNNFDLSIEDLQFEARCIGQCDSPILNNIVGGSFIVSTNTQESEQLAELFQGFIEFIINYLESSPAQRLINVALENSAETCASLFQGIREVFRSREEYGDVFFILIYLCIAVVVFLCLVLCYQYPKHKRIMAQRIRAFEQMETKEFSTGNELRIFANEMRALAWSPVVAPVWRVLVPIICFANMISLTWAVTSQGAMTVLLTLTLLGMEMNTIDLVPFTIISTVNDVWFAGGWYLAIMIVGFSFLWPIVKNIFLLFLWYTPTTLINQDSRASWLGLLDMLGKWSFMDVFVVSLTLAALAEEFDFSQKEELSGVLNDQFLKVVITMRPEIGIIMLSVVSSSSLLVNHLMSYLSRKTKFHYQHEYDVIAGVTETPKRALVSKAVVRYRFAGRIMDRFRGTCLNVFHWVGALIMVIGIFTPIIKFEMRGLIGLLLEDVDESLAFKEFSLMDLGALIIQAPTANAGERLVMIMFVVIYYLVIFIGPVAQVFAVGVLFLKSFNLQGLDTMLYLTNTISYWGALDVALVALGATLLQVKNLTDFIVNFITDDLCSNLDGIITNFVPGEEDDSCFEVAGFFGFGVVFLLIGVIMQTISLGCIILLSGRAHADWYYFAYVLHGHRKRESKPKKLTFIKQSIYEFFTNPTAQKRMSGETGVGSMSPSATGSKKINSVNPRFSPRSQSPGQRSIPPNFGSASGSGFQSGAAAGGPPGVMHAQGLGAAPRSSAASGSVVSHAQSATPSGLRRNQGMSYQSQDAPHLPKSMFMSGIPNSVAPPSLTPSMIAAQEERQGSRRPPGNLDDVDV